MTYRTFLLLGLVMALPAVPPLAAQAADSKPAQWLVPGTTAASGSAEEAAQLARQAAELAARAAQMAAAAQNATSSAATAAPPTTTAAPAVNATAISSAPAANVLPSLTNGVQQPQVIDIRFQNSPPAPTTNFNSATAPLATVTAAPTILAPAASTPQSQPSIHTDSQVHLATTTYTDGRLLRAAQEEPLPAAPGTTPMTPIAPNAYGGNGECMDESCCPPQRVLFWTGGVEATFLSPDLNSQGVTFEVEEIDEDRDDIFTSQSNDVDSLYVSPRAWIGIQGCRWGANLRYWHLQASEGAYDPSLGSLGGFDDFDCGLPDIGFFSCSRLEAYTVDLELTRRFCINDCWMQASVGVRHAEIEHNESITGLALTDEGLLQGYSRANRNTRGTGLLFGLYGRKPVFPCSCVNWFYNLRWSTLWGPTETAAETFASVQSSDPNFVASASSVNAAYTAVDDTLFIGEVQLGLEWTHALQCIPANAFCRFAVEYQRWDGGSGYSAADSFAGITITGETDPTSIVSTTGAAEEPQMDLVGFTFGTGLTW
jgi:hypothetical protein